MSQDGADLSDVQLPAGRSMPVVSQFKYLGDYVAADGADAIGWTPASELVSVLETGRVMVWSLQGTRDANETRTFGARLQERRVPRQVEAFARRRRHVGEGDL